MKQFISKIKTANGVSKLAQERENFQIVGA